MFLRDMEDLGYKILNNFQTVGLRLFANFQGGGLNLYMWKSQTQYMLLTIYGVYKIYPDLWLLDSHRRPSEKSIPPLIDPEKNIPSP